MNCKNENAKCIDEIERNVQTDEGVNIRDYIESGILETYALGLCTDAECREVEAMLANHPELHTELNAIEETLEKFAHTQSKQPPLVLREKVLTQITTTQREAKIVELSSTSAKPVAEQKKKLNWLAAASVALLIVSIGGNILLWNKYNSTQGELLALRNENSEMAENLNTKFLEMARLFEHHGVKAMLIVRLAGGT